VNAWTTIPDGVRCGRVNCCTWAPTCGSTATVILPDRPVHRLTLKDLRPDAAETQKAT